MVGGCAGLLVGLAGFLSLLPVRRYLADSLPLTAVSWVLTGVIWCGLLVLSEELTRGRQRPWRLLVVLVGSGLAAWIASAADNTLHNRLEGFAGVFELGEQLLAGLSLDPLTLQNYGVLALPFAAIGITRVWERGAPPAPLGRQLLAGTAATLLELFGQAHVFSWPVELLLAAALPLSAPLALSLGAGAERALLARWERQEADS